MRITTALFDRLARIMPVFDWGRRYDRDAFGNDMVAAVIVTIMLIPQSLAYALLAGLPAETGIYASIAPILLYAIFGTSRALAVGPVAVVSLIRQPRYAIPPDDSARTSARPKKCRWRRSRWPSCGPCSLTMLACCGMGISTKFLSGSPGHARSSPPPAFPMP